MSVSIDERMLEEVSKIRQEWDFTGRSEVVRAALSAMIAENSELSRLKGQINAIMLVTHKEKYSENFSGMKHRYQELIRTQVHNCIEGHKCLEIFILKGEAKKVSEMFRDFKANRKTEFAKLVVS